VGNPWLQQGVFPEVAPQARPPISRQLPIHVKVGIFLLPSTFLLLSDKLHPSVKEKLNHLAAGNLPDSCCSHFADNFSGGVSQ
jgi:hypothetical protein